MTWDWTQRDRGFDDLIGFDLSKFAAAARGSGLNQCTRVSNRRLVRILAALNLNTRIYIGLLTPHKTRLHTFIFMSDMYF